MIVELYKLCDKTKREELEEVCGIYAILYNNEVIYVGQSINIRSRLASHTSKAKINQYAKRDQNDKNTQLKLEFYTLIQEHMDEIQFLYIPCNKKELDKYEEYYINKYKPKYNYAGVYIRYKKEQKKHSELTENLQLK